MSISIYCFSATGNSLTTANALAEKLGGSVTAVASTRALSKVKVDEGCGAVGFVFPVYYGNMPYPVRELISKMVFAPDTYIFIATTYRGHAGPVANKVDQLLRTRSQKLSLAVGLPMPGNSFINEPEVDAQHLANQSANIEAIAAKIANREVEDYSTDEILRFTPIDFPNNFRGIESDENCIGCGICAKVCPMGNIRIENGRSIIGDECATCLSCFHWCPKEAIWMSKQEDIARRKKYRHPDVKLKDIIAQKG